jgi:hypothetical protein
MTESKTRSGRAVRSNRLLAVLVVPTNTASEVVKMAADAGYLVIPCDDPSKVSVLAPTHLVGTNDLMMSAMHSIVEHGCTSQYVSFGKELIRRMKARESETGNAAVTGSESRQ